MRNVTMSYGLLALVLILSGQVGPKLGDTWLEAQMIQKADKQPSYTKPKSEVPLAYFMKESDGTHMVKPSVAKSRAWARIEGLMILTGLLAFIAAVLWVEMPLIKELWFSHKTVASWLKP